ncbi:MAG TPA: hypothetical protein VI911_09415 [Patescibacteria group bacterium]|nr:MAG: hypothetical protein UR43_C0005G0135 [candidate division TM6 bacterium GW2011_GWF2_33_332]HLD91216.1 hypothetical protein [Patescibacteria group bacterium]
MRNFPLEKDKIDKNQIWTISSNGTPMYVCIGNVDSFNLLYNLPQNLLDELLEYGWCNQYNRFHFETYNFKLNDTIKDTNTNTQYEISDVTMNICNNIFVAKLWDIDNFKSIEMSLGDLEYNISSQEYEIIEKEEDLVSKEIDDFFSGVDEKKELPCSIYNKDCEIVTSYMPVSGKSFKMCRTHKKEVF